MGDRPYPKRLSVPMVVDTLKPLWTSHRHPMVVATLAGVDRAGHLHIDQYS
jgi:hypothetical protein